MAKKKLKILMSYAFDRQTTAPKKNEFLDFLFFDNSFKTDAFVLFLIMFGFFRKCQVVPVLNSLILRARPKRATCFMNSLYIFVNFKVGQSWELSNNEWMSKKNSDLNLHSFCHPLRTVTIVKHAVLPEISQSGKTSSNPPD